MGARPRVPTRWLWAAGLAVGVMVAVQAAFPPPPQHAPAHQQHRRLDQQLPWWADTRAATAAEASDAIRARAQCHAIERACLHDSEVVVYDRGPEDAKPVLDPGCDEGGEQGDLAPRDR